MEIEKSTSHIEVVEIGLALSKNIREAHGEYLVYKNDDEKTTFIICLVET